MKNIILLFAVLSTLITSAQQIPKGLTASNKIYIGFYEYKPSNYSSNTSTKYPLIIFLHGLGERGNGTTELAKVLHEGIPSYIENGNTMTFTWNGKTETFLVLSPQLPFNYTNWQDFYIDEMIKYAKANLRVDTNRIFLTGFSSGGSGTWHYASSSLANASHLAGIVPVCGGCSVSNACNIANGKTAVWAFHSTDDKTISYTCTVNAITNINKCSPAAIPEAMLYSTGDHFIWNKAYSFDYYYQNPNVWEWMLNQNRSLPANKKPVVKAGPDLKTTTNVAKVNLSAGGSFDPDGTILKYVWRKLSGPAFGILSPASSSNGVATVTGLTVPGTYRYELKGVDSRASWAMDTVNIAVTGDTIITAAEHPTARAGANVTIKLPLDSASLDGKWSSDADGSLVSFKWSKVSGPAQYSIANPNTAVTKARSLVQGTYGFRLLVTDNAGLTGFDTIFITVSSNGTVTPPSSNLPPVARAGSDVTITLPANSAPLDGKWSSDPEKIPMTFTWTKISGPAQYSIVSHSANSAVCSADNLAKGVYAFRLEVTDAGGLKDADTMIVFVNGATAIAAVSGGVMETMTVRDSIIVSPNPAISSINISFTSSRSGRLTINIFDANGSIRSSRTGYKTGTQYIGTLPVGNLFKGTYYVELITDDKRKFVTRLIKQ